MASLPPDEIAYQMAHSDENWSYTLQVLCSVFTGVAVAMFGARIFARYSTKAHLGWDDWLAFISTILLVGLNITVCIEASYGIGRHLVLVAQNPTNFTNIGKANLAFSIIYAHCMTFARLCILAFLARIFTFNYSLIRWGTYIISVLVILLYIAGMLVILVPCQPISTWWGSPEQCRHPTWTESLAINVTGSVQDFLILLLPQPIIWKLHGFNLRRKIGLSLLFMVGLFAAIVSVVRIPMLKPSPRLNGKPYDSTYDSADGLAFSVIEPACVIICACMPMLPGIYRRASDVTKKWISSIRSSSGSSAGGSRHRGVSGGLGRDSDSNASSSRGNLKASGLEPLPLPPLPTPPRSARSGSGMRDQQQVYDGRSEDEKMVFGPSTTVVHEVSPTRGFGDDGSAQYPQPDGQPKLASIV